MAIASFPGLVIDCPDAAALATFYGSILDWKVSSASSEDDEWAEIRPADGSNCISFQQVEDFQAPTWPSQEKPQQMHLDVVVDDLDAAEIAVVALGAARAEHQPGKTFRVMLDPAGHPFCLCLS